MIIESRIYILQIKIQCYNKKTISNTVNTKNIYKNVSEYVTINTKKKSISNTV